MVEDIESRVVKINNGLIGEDGRQLISPKQLAWMRLAVSDESARHFIAHGETGSGKSSSNALAMISWLFSPAAPKDGVIIFCGRTMGSIQNNIISQFQNEYLFGDLSKFATFKQKRPGIHDFFGRDVTMVSSNDPKAALQKLRGTNACASVVDEMIFIDQKLVGEIPHRLRAGGPTAIQKSWWSTNPAGPAHWVKRDYIDRSEPGGLLYTGGWRHASFVMSDNPGLPPDRKQKLMALTKDSDRYRTVFGKWVAPGGAVFPFNEYDNVKSSENCPKIVRMLAAGIDYGERAPSAVVVIGLTDDNRIQVLDELYLKTGRGGEVRTQNTLVEEISVFLRQVCDDYDWGQRIIEFVSFDSAAQGFGAELRKNKFISRFRIHGSVKGAGSIERGIRRIRALMLSEKLIITEKTPELNRELANYAWDIEETDRTGTDTLLKNQSDHAIDALRYALDVSFNQWARAVGLNEGSFDPVYPEDIEGAYVSESPTGWNSNWS